MSDDGKVNVNVLGDIYYDFTEDELRNFLATKIGLHNTKELRDEVGAWLLSRVRYQLRITGIDGGTK